MLASVTAWLLLITASAAADPPTAQFTVAPEHPAAGELVTFESTSTPAPEHTAPLILDWDLDGDGEFDDARGAVAKQAYPAGVHVVRLRARHATTGNHTAVAERTITVGEATQPTPTPTPTVDATPQPTAVPAGNAAPVAAFDRDCTLTGRVYLCAGLFAREQKPHTFDASPSHDADGSIVRYEWDLDGSPGFERDTGASAVVTHTFERFKGLFDPGKRTVHVRVTDDRGATSEAELTLSLLEPACEPLVTKGRLRATGLCLRPRNVEFDGHKVVRWYSERPVTVNGIAISPAANRTVTIDLPVGAGTPRIASNGAVVTLPAVQSPAVDLLNGAFSWGMADGTHLSGVTPGANAKLNGLKITGLAEAPSLTADGTSSRFALRVALPQQFGGATSDGPIVLTPGKATAAASAPLSFNVANASIGPIGLKQLKVTFDGEDLWEISTQLALPSPIPYTVSADAGIRAGAFEHAGAEVQFGTPGIGPFGPVFVQRIAFRIEINPKRSKCVPQTGVELIDVRKTLHDITGNWYDNISNFEVDHGMPTFALCGEVGLTAGPQVLGTSAIRLDAGLGLATYADRPAVFRAFGKLYVVEIPVADADLEVHTNGYVRARGKFYWGIGGLASLKGYLRFEMMAPKFNAEAHVEACLEFIDWCAGAKAIVSSRGVAVCLKIDVLFDDWMPGFGYRWGDTTPDLYLAGCDIGPYKEHISSGLDQHIRAVPASVQGESHAIDLPAGLPGATIVATGEGAPPKVTLIGPKGERITSPDDLRPVQQAPFLILKDQRANLTQFAIAKPSAGRWQVIVEDGSAPVLSLASANGLPKPEIEAKVTGRGRRHTLEYDVKPVPGQKVTFLERGASAGKPIGDAAAAHGRLAFRPAPGKGERRRIVALVTQDGHARGEYDVAGYTAPAVQRPGSPRDLRVARRGSTLRLTWSAAREADLHEVRVRVADGRRLTFRTRRSALTVRGIRPRVGAVVSVRGLLDTGLAGPFSTKRSA